MRIIIILKKNTQMSTRVINMKRRILLEIEQSTLFELIQRHALSISDFKCMDKETKQFVRLSYLEMLKKANTKKASGYAE